MATLPKATRKVSTLLHFLGLSSLGSALFLQSIVFASILRSGYFIGIEQNRTILLSELTLTCFGIAYLAYMFFHFIQIHK